MSIKEIITYLLTVIGIGLICYVRVIFSLRQQSNPDNQYSKKELQIRKLAIIIIVLAILLALIPIY